MDGTPLVAAFEKEVKYLLDEGIYNFYGRTMEEADPRRLRRVQWEGNMELMRSHWTMLYDSLKGMPVNPAKSALLKSYSRIVTRQPDTVKEAHMILLRMHTTLMTLRKCLELHGRGSESQNTLEPHRWIAPVFRTMREYDIVHTHKNRFADGEVTDLQKRFYKNSPLTALTKDRLLDLFKTPETTAMVGIHKEKHDPLCYYILGRRNDVHHVLSWASNKNYDRIGVPEAIMSHLLEQAGAGPLGYAVDETHANPPEIPVENTKRRFFL